ncbi:MAG: hypothetical protein ACT4P6_16010 [Gemmatimonadaceae bacterium]
MNLSELARLVDAEPKWVLNTLAALGNHPRYSLGLARRLAVARAISETTDAPFAHSFRLAERALRAGTQSPIVTPEGKDAGVWIDTPRILSAFNVRLSVLRTTFAPRQRGRLRARRRDPLQVAHEHGIDLTLLVDNARKTPEQRLRQLDAMLRFSRDTRRAAARW